MHVIFSVCPARKTGTGFQAIVMSGAAPALARKVAQVSGLPDLVTQLDAYKAEAEATGKPLLVSIAKHPRDKSRTLPGFKTLADERFFTTAAETATEAEMEAIS